MNLRLSRCRPTNWSAAGVGRRSRPSRSIRSRRRWRPALAFRRHRAADRVEPGGARSERPERRPEQPFLGGDQQHANQRDASNSNGNALTITGGSITFSASQLAARGVLSSLGDHPDEHRSYRGGNQQDSETNLSATATTSRSRSTWPRRPAGFYRRVVVVMEEENQGYSDIIGNTIDAPYINDTLAADGAVLANDFALRASEQSKLHRALFGNSFGIADDDLQCRPTRYGGAVTNAVGASILGGTGGVYGKYRAAATVTNSGSIKATTTGSAAIFLDDGGAVTNNASAFINGQSFGVFIAGASGTVANSGSIGSTKYGAVRVAAGNVTNNVSGTISGGSNGIYVGSGGTVVNYGSVNAAAAGGASIYLTDGGTAINNVGGVVTGSGSGIFANHAPATVTNSGSVGGADAVALEGGGSVTNNANASISGQAEGVFVQSGSATVANFGSISATAAGGAAVDVEAGGSVTNNAGAAISGSAFGVFIAGVTVTNDSTISGGSYAVKFSGSATVNRLVVGPGAEFPGGVGGADSGNNTLEFAGGSGTLNASGGGGSVTPSGGPGWSFFHDFNTIDVDAGGSWTFSGTDGVSVIGNNGTVAVTGSVDVSSSIDPSSTGVFDLENAGTLEVAAALGSGAQIAFLGSAEAIIDAAAQFGANVGQSNYAGSLFDDFAAGDSIDLKDVASTGVSL